ncbi:MAG: hypothetical protein EOP48_28905 [Sphingobacteriales bacterium]|nr:MAG: hypothetical protein EOP48_28905 [Sphingobacteriales bacterium]
MCIPKTFGVLIFGLSLFLGGCCGFVEEEHLGNNFRLSEYDNVDRRILYSEEKCSGSGIEIVPMTVTEYAYDSKWIIAKSRTSRFETAFQYWIIDKGAKIEVKAESGSTSNVIKPYLTGPLDSVSFIQMINANNIDLTLKKI